MRVHMSVRVCVRSTVAQLSQRIRRVTFYTQVHKTATTTTTTSCLPLVAFALVGPRNRMEPGTYFERCSLRRVIIRRERINNNYIVKIALKKEIAVRVVQSIISVCVPFVMDYHLQVEIYSQSRVLSIFANEAQHGPCRNGRVGKTIKNSWTTYLDRTECQKWIYNLKVNL